ncbi:MAG: hypothetical protein GVY15_03005 [Bacteroidetes bacterium]|jgi:hypothetical protein|nr:hypothetical protein [Bacteroidota bacterium]
MYIRSLLSILFALTGAVFFVLALNAWADSNDQRPDVPIEEISRQMQVKTDLDVLTEESVLGHSNGDFRRNDIVSLLFVKPNYDCSSCISKYNTFVSSLHSVSASDEVSVGHASILVEPNLRTAVHFAKVNRLRNPIFRIAGAEELTGAGLVANDCSVIFVDPEKGIAFFALDLEQMPATVEAQQILGAVNKAYEAVRSDAIQETLATGFSIK